MEQEKGKGHYISLAVKIIIVVLVLGFAFYIVYFKTMRGRARMILSDREIESSSDDYKTSDFNINSRIYFHISRRNSTLDGAEVALDIEKMKGDDFSHYKRISYEIDRQFKKIQSYIPEEYLSGPGKYRIKLLIDGKVMSVEEINVGE
ncbi:MAG: hypothetical protein JXA20_06035 [Spirochaetes bacterium]|nr:hypothetical protein [Spirochaetota bacterium]